MTTDPTQREKWREAYVKWCRGPNYPISAATKQESDFAAGYLAAQPKRPSVEEVARLRNVLAEVRSRARQAEVFHDRLGGASKCFAEIEEVARLALFESPAHDR